MIAKHTNYEQCKALVFDGAVRKSLRTALELGSVVDWAKPATTPRTSLKNLNSETHAKHA